MNKRIPAGVILLCLLSLQLTAQLKAPLSQAGDKSLLFASLPQHSVISKPSLEKLFDASFTENVKLPIGNNNVLEGFILEKIRKNSQAFTVNIRLPGYDNALFTITRITDKTGIPTYIGRVVNNKYADLLLLKIENDTLFLSKEKQALVLVE